jgi:hypothetical protein
LTAEKKLAFMRGFVGKEVEAITLGHSSPEQGTCGDGHLGRPAKRSEEAPFTEALTDSYLKLRLRGRHEPNRWLGAQVEGVVDGVLVGRDAICRENL